MKKILGWFCCVICCLVMVGGMPLWVSPAAAQGSLTLLVQPETLQLAGEQTAQASVVVKNVEGLYGVDVSLTFDPDVVEVVDADPSLDGVQVGFGKFLDSGFVLLNRVDNELGQVHFAMTQLYPSTAKSGSGILIVLTLRGKRVGAATPLTISGATLAGQGGNELVSAITSGSVAVLSQVSGPTNTPVPTQGAGTPMPTGTIEPTQYAPAAVDEATYTPTSTSLPATSQPTATAEPTNTLVPTSTSVPKAPGSRATAVSAQQPPLSAAVVTQPVVSAPETDLPVEATATSLAVSVQAEASLPTITAVPPEASEQTGGEPSQDLAVQSGLPKKSAAGGEPSLGVASSENESQTAPAWNGMLFWILLGVGVVLVAPALLMGVIIWVQHSRKNAR